MLRFLIFLLTVLVLALLFAWVADNPGTVYLQWDWLASRLGRPGEEVGIPLGLFMVAIVILVVVAMMVSSLLRGVFGMPGFITRFFDNRRRERGYRALSRGLIAASSGDIDSARSFTKESRRYLENDPLVSLLGTQTALLEGDRDAARENFKAMLENDETRLVALRGLFLEAERQGEAEAARHYAEEAAHEAPALGWAGTAKLRYQAADGDWELAMQTLEANRAAGLVDRKTAKRQRAVLLTAKAISVEQAEPETARKLAKEAHKLAKDLVPAATTYARAASRLGDVRGASKVIESCWNQMPHPELASAYAEVRTGDSVQDRLKRAKKLAGIKENHPEGAIALAIAAIDAKDWEQARNALEPVLTSRPSERACLLMADIEEGEHGDRGRMRDWLSRALRAPADEAWTADGHVSEEWMPMSPVTGEIDAFEWKVPVAQLGDRPEPTFSVEELQADALPLVSEAEANAANDDADSEVEEAIVIETESKNKASNDVEEEDQENADNVVVIEPTRRQKNKEAAASTDTENVGDEGIPLETESDENGGSPYANTVKFPLDRRPDDPGPHPDKQPPKKGFKLF